MRQTSIFAALFVLLWILSTSAQQSRSRDDVRNEAAARALGASAPSTGPPPRLTDGRPDFSGVWFGGGSTGNIEDGLAAGERLELLPEAQKLWVTRLAADDPMVNCLPSGVPRIALLPWRIVQTASHVFFLFENDSYRQIFMDGRPHPTGDALNPTWYGHSVGRWDGDTLVIDTVGFNDRSWFDYVGHSHSEQLHVVERWTRVDFGSLENRVTIEDPGTYARPFTTTFKARLLPGVELLEYICSEDNRDPVHLKGLASEVRGPGQ
jgi:hypothetical protein